MDNVKSRLINVAAQTWEPLMEGVQAKQLWADPGTGRRALMTRVDPGFELPTHRHCGDELVFLLDGDLSDEWGKLTAGSIGYRPDGCVHTVSSSNGATAIAVITGGVEPSSAQLGGPPSETYDISSIQWTQALPGVCIKPVWQDTEARRRVVLARFEPGSKLPLHRHDGDELIFVIEGQNEDEAGPVPTGDMSYRPDGCTHSVWSANGATCLNFVWGDTEML